jgi:hypothetical protein
MVEPLYLADSMYKSIIWDSLFVFISEFCTNALNDFLKKYTEIELVKLYIQAYIFY